jgi:hypothetical protein
MMALTGAAYSAPQLSAQAIEHATEAQASNSASATFQWKSPAQLHRLFPLSKVRGTLFLDVSGVEFVSDSGQRQKWTALDFETFTIKPHKLVLHTYHDRGLGRLGEDSKEFNLAESVPPSVAAWLAGYAGRPSRNAVPAAVSTSSTDIGPDQHLVAVHHRAVFGGTSGVLRFRQGGIDYITNVPGGSRSWRWEDIQTLSEPNPYLLYVFGYKDTFTFDLKEPLDRTLYEHATAAVSAYQENGPSNAARLEAPKM